MKPHILVIEDDPQIRRFLKATLTAEDYRYLEAPDAASGQREAAAHQPDLILLDLGLPDRDGLDLIPAIRAFSQAPILVLSARGQEADKITALDTGADDYIGKPFAVGELMARVRAALRRSTSTEQGSVTKIGDVEVDLAKRTVSRAGTDLHLTPTEYRLLQTLLKHAGKVLTHRQLLNEVWGPNHTEHSQYLRVYMAQLRRKLEPTPTRPQYLHTEPGVGYRLLLD